MVLGGYLCGTVLYKLWGVANCLELDCKGFGWQIFLILTVKFCSGKLS
jgi:hypothetical protein